MNPNSLILQIVSRSDTMLYLWCLFVVAGLGVLVIAARSSTTQSLARFLFFGFGFFAMTHLLCLQWLLKQWLAAVSALQKTDQWKLGHADIKADLFSVLEAPAAVWVVPFHILFDAFILFGIWWLTRKRGL